MDASDLVHPVEINGKSHEVIGFIGFWRWLANQMRPEMGFRPGRETSDLRKAAGK